MESSRGITVSGDLFNMREEAHKNTLSFSFRLLGFFPLCFFLAHLRYHFLYGTPENLLWMCNFSNLLLAAGILFHIPVLIRIAFLWAIPGLPLWMVDMLHTGDYPVSTFLSHAGGFAIGLIGIIKVGADRISWFYALIYALSIQQVCRFMTPPELNVNVAFRPYYGWEHTFDSYIKWWLFTAVMAAAALWLMGELLLRILPHKKRLLE